ncbi:MAG TPA: response regulator transcription factor [Allosphingosinicella sp.]|nr:response regulator transcription factor [Allosphingosinicella sp.]
MASSPRQSLRRVLIADDHPLVLTGMEAVLRHSTFEVVGTADGGEGVLASLETLDPEILVLDVNMPEPNGLELLRILRGRGDRRPVILVTATISDEAIFEAVELGVDGLMSKDCAATSLIQCLEAVRSGGQWIDQVMQKRGLDHARRPRPAGADGLGRLTPRERTVADLVAGGMRNREIGLELGVTEGSVKVYLHRMYEKLGIQTRLELAMLMHHKKSERS